MLERRRGHGVSFPFLFSFARVDEEYLVDEREIKRRCSFEVVVTPSTRGDRVSTRWFSSS